MKKDLIKEGNETIHIFMGWEYMSTREKVAYTINREVEDPDAFCAKIDNLPDLKRKGSVINTLSHDDIFYSSLLKYNKSFDALIPVLEKIRDNYLKHNGDDLIYTIQYLLEGGKRLGSLKPIKQLSFSVENLWDRCILMIKYHYHDDYLIANDKPVPPPSQLIKEGEEPIPRPI